MTAEEWEATRGPVKMLKVVGRTASVRRARLYACACVRQHWHLLGKRAPSREAVSMAESYADGRATKVQLKRARHRAASAVRRYPLDYLPSDWVATAATYAASVDVHAYLEGVEYSLSRAVEKPAGSAGERTYRAALLRCVFGNPLRLPFTVSPAVLSHNDGAAVKLATVIYEDRMMPSGELDVGRLGMLADALEEAGVDDDTALAHLRGTGPHARGCHVVDAVFGRS